MTLEDEFRLLVGGYFGIREMDDYPLKIYILQDIDNYIKDFLKENPISNFDYRKEAEKIEEQLPLKRKLQDSMLVLKKINAPLDLELLIKARIRKINEKNQAF